MRLLPASCRPTIASGCGSTALAASVARRQPAPRPPTAQPPRRGELHSRVTSHKAARQLHFPHQSVAACATQPNCCPLPPPASPIQASRRQWAPLVQHCREQWGDRTFERQGHSLRYGLGVGHQQHEAYLQRVGLSAETTASGCACAAYLPACLPVCLTACLSAYPPACVLTCPPACLSACRSPS